MSERHDPRLTVDPISTYQDAHHQARYRWAVEKLRGVEGQVLDIACGDGYGSNMLAKAGLAVIGLDASTLAVEHAARSYSHPTLSYSVGNAERLSGIKDASVAAVVSFETIEHLHDPRSFLAEANRVLMPGGVLLLSTPNRLLASTLYPLRGKPNNPFHVFEYTLSTFREDLQLQFPDAKLYGQGFVPAWLAFWPVQVALKAACRAFRFLGAYRLIDRWYHDPRDVEVKGLDQHAHSVASFFIAESRRT